MSKCNGRILERLRRLGLSSRVKMMEIVLFEYVWKTIVWRLKNAVDRFGLNL